MGPFPRATTAIAVLMLSTAACNSAEANTASLRTSVDSLKLEMALLRAELRRSRMQGSAALIDPYAEQAFGVVRVPFGSLAIKLTGVEPLGDGSRVTLQIG